MRCTPVSKPLALQRLTALRTSSAECPRPDRRRTPSSRDWAPISTALTPIAARRSSPAPSMSSGRVEMRTERTAPSAMSEAAAWSSSICSPRGMPVKLPP